MKCYKCGEAVSGESNHCEHCGALLKITLKLLTTVQAGNKEAIIQLYKMLYNNVYNRFFQLGIDKQEIPGLINKAYKDFVLHSHEVTSVETFEPYFYGICDNVAFTYLKSNGLEPQELDQETFVEPDQSIIDNMLEEIDKKDDEKPPKEKRKSHKWIIFVVVIALIVAGTGGYYGFSLVNQKVVEKKREQEFASVSLQYVEAVQMMSNRGNSDGVKLLKEKYPLVRRQASVTVIKKNDTNFFDKKNLVSVKYDVDGDHAKELLIGYKDGEKTVIMGIYKYDGKKTIVINPIENMSKEWTLIFTKNHKILRGIRDNENKSYIYSLLQLKNNKLITLKSPIQNVSKYMKKNGLQKASVMAKPIQYNQRKIKLPPTDQDLWLHYIKEGRYKDADKIGKKMQNNIEDPCVAAMSKKMREAYLNKVTSYMWKYDGFSESADGYVRSVLGYMLTDMDGDRVPELIIEWGVGSNVDDNLAIFTYKNGHLRTIAEKVWVGIGKALLYYPNHAGLIEDYGHMDVQTISIISVENGKVKVNKVAELHSHLYVTSGLELSLHVNGENEIGAGHLNLSILNSDS